MRTGKYIKQLSSDYQYKAFIPNDLPFEIKHDEILQDLLSRADQALGRLDGIAETFPDIDFFILMYTRKEATLSSQIEGTQATFSDLLKAEYNIEDSEIHNDVDEIMNYIRAMNHGLSRLDTFPLSLPLIKEIHFQLLQGVRGEHKRPGEFRNSQNWIGGNSIQTAMFVPPSVHEMLKSLYNLENFLYEKSPMPVLIKAGLIHYQFETIHPFLDGNGRIGRLLITFYLCHRNVLKKPFLYLSEFFKKNRQEYYDRLNGAREKDDLEGWLKFFLEGVFITANNASDTIRKIVKLRESDRDLLSKSGRKNENSILLFNSLYKQPIVTIKQVEKITSLKNPNALALVLKFENLGILKEITGKKKNRIYVYDNYVKLFE